MWSCTCKLQTQDSSNISGTDLLRGAGKPWGDFHPPITVYFQHDVGMFLCAILLFMLGILNPYTQLGKKKFDVVKCWQMIKMNRQNKNREKNRYWRRLLSGLPLSKNKSSYYVTLLRDPPTLETGWLTTSFSHEL